MRAVHYIIQSLLCSPKFLGRDFLIETLPKLFIKKTTSKVIVSTRFGFKIELDPNFDQSIENVIYERGVYELGTVKVLQDMLKPGDTFLDVGANIGFLSLLASNLVSKNGHVLAFEPVNSTYQILEKNKNINGFNQMQLFKFALGNEQKTEKIFNEGNNRGGASIVNQHGVDSEEIEVKRLDDLNLATKIDAIKIDVEGFELEVLKGAKKQILKDQPKLIVEFSRDRENIGGEFGIYDWLNELGIYKIYKLKNGKERCSALIEIKEQSDLPAHDNIFCFPI
ncbi:MAG: FkbM family methyltransferase [Putridiphycobacter sp.]